MVLIVTRIISVRLETAACDGSLVPFVSVLSLPLHNFLFASADTSWHTSVMLMGDPGGCVSVCAQYTMVKSVFSSPHSFIICTRWQLFPSCNESCFRLLTCMYRGTRTPFLCVCVPGHLFFTLLSPASGVHYSCIFFHESGMSVSSYG